MTDDAPKPDRTRARKGQKHQLKAEAGEFTAKFLGSDVEAASLFEEEAQARRERLGSSRREFEHEAGQFIFTFAKLDQLLFGLFKTLLARDDRIAAVLYYRNSQFGGRLPLVTDMVIECINSADVVDCWKALRSRIERLAETRNLLAHHPFGVYVYTRLGPDGVSGKEFLGAAYPSAEGAIKPHRKVWQDPTTQQARTAGDVRIDLPLLKKRQAQLAAVMQEVVSFASDVTQNPAWLERKWVVRVS